MPNRTRLTITPAELQAQILKIQGAKSSIYEKDQRVLEIFQEKLNKHGKETGFPSSRAREILKDMDVLRLSLEQKFSLFSHLAKGDTTVFTDETEVIKHILFEIRDQILKEASKNPSNIKHMIDVAQQLQLPKLEKEIIKVDQRKPILLALIKKTNRVNSQNWKYFKLHKEIAKAKQANNGKSYRSLIATLEYRGASVAGVASVTTSLSKFMSEEGHDIRVITPCYDTYVEMYPETKFVTTIEHYYKGKWITSSIYKVWTQDNKVPQYLLKPDYEFSQLMEIGKSNLVYQDNLQDRTTFLSSAVAGFASRYNGRKHQKQFDLLHTHSFYLTPCLKLMKEVYSPKRKKANLSHVSLAEHIHGTGYFEQGSWISKKAFTDQGLEAPSIVNLQAEGYRYSDIDIHVGEKTAELAKTNADGYSLEKFVQESSKRGRVCGVQNGVPVESFQPTNRKVFGDFTFSSQNGVIDFIGGRAKIKKALYDEGIIADPEKPLFMFVGRFTLQKGLDVLPTMIQRIHKEGGQCLIMGIHQGDPIADKDIAALEKLAKKYPGTLKVMTTIEEQKVEFRDSKVSVGTLIRAATFASVMPSHREPGGLVIKEMWASGAIGLTSNAEGIGDNGRGLGKSDGKGSKYTTENFNAFTYKDQGNYIHHAERAAYQAMKFYKETSPEKRNEVCNRIYNEAKDNYTWKSSIKQLESAYAKAVKPLTSEETKAKQMVYNKYMKRNKGFLGRLRLRLHKFFTGTLWKAFKAKVLYVLTLVPFKISQIAQRIFHPKKKKTV